MGFGASETANRGEALREAARAVPNILAVEEGGGEMGRGGEGETGRGEGGADGSLWGLRLTTVV